MIISNGDCVAALPAGYKQSENWIAVFAFFFAKLNLNNVSMPELS